MAIFSPLLDVLAEIPDPRRAEGKLYQLPYVLLFAILAIVSGCNSYRGIITFIDVHRHRLNAIFALKWRRRCSTPDEAWSFAGSGFGGAAYENP